MARQTFFGLRAHVRVSWPGVISAVSLAPANIHDLEMTKEVLEGAAGWALADRFHAKKVWARDAWHLLSRWLRKILSHTLAVFCCIQAGLPPLHFADLLTE